MSKTVNCLECLKLDSFPEINKKTKALIADFDCSYEVILELIFGQFQPSGKMPFELPASVAAVEQQKEDVPYDSENPLYPFGFGMSYRIN